MAPRSPSGSRYRSRSRDRYQSRSPPPRDQYSRSPSPDRRNHHGDYPERSSPRRNGRYRDDSRDRSASRSQSPSRDRDRDRQYDSRSPSRSRSRTPRSPSPANRTARSTKIVVERLTKNITVEHLWEIFGTYGEIEDMDVPIGRTTGHNRGTAYILYYAEADAEAAIANMHEARVDGAVIHVSIVLPRRKMSPSPPTANRGANINPLLPPPPHARRGPPGGPGGFGCPGPMGGGGGRGRRDNLGDPARYGPRSDVYRPRSMSRLRSPPAGGSRRHRSRSRSYSRSRSPPPARGYGGGGGRGRGGGGGRGGGRRYDDYDDYDRRRSSSRDSYGSYRSRSRGHDR